MHPINGEIVLSWYKPTAEYFIATFCQCGKQHTVVWKKAGTAIAHVRYERTWEAEAWQGLEQARRGRVRGRGKDQEILHIQK